ncbi:hypothetical protein B0O80DRAFT_450546 [Mortierella sp. GBAus27b]|nr:hypothetical protein B0O80DRAFT_450546 [Mortierella sp. GBAus27b]
MRRVCHIWFLRPSPKMARFGHFAMILSSRVLLDLASALRCECNLSVRSLGDMVIEPLVMRWERSLETMNFRAWILPFDMRCMMGSYRRPRFTTSKAGPSKCDPLTVRSTMSAAATASTNFRRSSMVTSQFRVMLSLWIPRALSRAA